MTRLTLVFACLFLLVWQTLPTLSALHHGPPISPSRPDAIGVPRRSTFAPKANISASVGEDGSGFQISFVNNACDGALNAYITGVDSDGRSVMITRAGEFYDRTADQSDSTRRSIEPITAIPLGDHGSKTTVTLPGYLASARIWVSEGTLAFSTGASGDGTGGVVPTEPSVLNPSDPSAEVNWGFVEFSYTKAGGLFANISYVDFVGLCLGMSLLSVSGGFRQVGGVRPGTLGRICTALKSQPRETVHHGISFAGPTKKTVRSESWRRAF